MEKLQVVSSRWTLMLKLLIPAFLLCFLGGLNIAMLFISLEDIKEPFTPLSARLTLFTFFFSIMALFYLMFMRIKWVALNETHILVSNMLGKNFKYTYDSIRDVEESKFLGFNQVRLHFHGDGKFGKSITFFANYYWHYYLKEHPQILETLLKAQQKK